MSMTTIKSFDDALDYFPGPAGRRSFLSRFGSTIKIYWASLREGIAAARLYNDLTRRGVPHDMAVRQTFDACFNGR
jgi:hypothetical protein